MLDVSKMDSEEKELWEMLTSKFEGKELVRVLQLIAIDSKKHQKEQLLNSRLHGVVQQSEQFYCDGQENNKDRCETQCLGCAGMQEIYGQ